MNPGKNEKKGLLKVSLIIGISGDSGKPFPGE